MIESYLDIDQVYLLTGLPKATLRNWEKRYGFPRPQRTAGGHRKYGVDEVKRIRRVVELCQNGLKLKEAIEKVLNEPLSEVETEESVAAVATPSPMNEEVGQILQALYKYDELSAERILSKVGMRLSESDLLQHIYARCLFQVGYDWESHRINVAQEHFSWNFFRTRLLSYFKSSQTTGEPLKFLLATPSGQMHEGGLIILAASMMLKGWRVYYLGLNLPVEDLMHATSTIQPDAVCLSAVEALSIQENWEQLSGLGVPVFVGGPCVGPLKQLSGVSSKTIHLMSGDLPKAINDIEVIVSSKSESKER